MTTLPIAAHVPHNSWRVLGFMPAINAVLAVFDVFSEAQSRARAAHKQYPFADW